MGVETNVTRGSGSGHSGHDSARTDPMRPFSLRRWVGYVLLGESVGFLIPAAGFAIAWLAGLPAWPAWALQVVLGLGEGTLLGLAQALALRGTPAEVPVRRWTLATALAAAAAWSMGMLPSTLIDSGVDVDFAHPGTWAALGTGGIVLLLTIPTAQWTVLRTVVHRAWRWIPLNAAAWAAGLVFTFLPSPVVDEATPPAVTAVLFALGGVGMALTVAVVTGAGLRRMLAGARDDDAG
ncbi:MAG: hypothetical protein ACQERF_02210 [Actinomycetota bacterium]